MQTSFGSYNVTLGPNHFTSGNDVLLPYNIAFEQSNFDVYSGGLFLDNIETEIFLDLSGLNIFLIILYGITFIAGILGNIFVIFVIIKFKSMRTLTNYFLVNLTVGDILVVLICIPVTLGSTVYKKWIYGEVLCKLTPFIQGSAVGVSVLSLLAISISRYYAIYKPLTAKIVFSTRNVRWMILGIWLISFASFSPLLAVNSVKTFPIFYVFETKICEENWGSQRDKNIFNMFVFCTLFVWPFILMMISYSVIGHTLWFTDPNLMEERKECTKHQVKTNLILRQRRRTVKMLISVVTIFGICWLPYYTVNFWLDFHIEDTTKTEQTTWVYTYIYPIVMILALSNSAMNPICYCFMSRGFRRGLRQILFCYGFFQRSSVFLKTSFKVKTTFSESFDTANV